MFQWLTSDEKYDQHESSKLKTFRILNEGWRYIATLQGVLGLRLPAISKYRMIKQTTYIALIYQQVLSHVKVFEFGASEDEPIATSLLPFLTAKGQNKVHYKSNFPGFYV